MAQGRGLLKEIFKNFINSLKPRKYWGEFRGKDHYGTEYYESPKTLHSRQSRWFVAKNNNFDQERPPEWEAWLRKTRKDPPTEEEIQFNILKMKKTLENARKIEGSSDKAKEEVKTFEKPAFPIYEEYEQYQVVESNKDDVKKINN